MSLVTSEILNICESIQETIGARSDLSNEKIFVDCCVARTRGLSDHAKVETIKGIYKEAAESVIRKNKFDFEKAVEAAYSSLLLGYVNRDRETIANAEMLIND